MRIWYGVNTGCMMLMAFGRLVAWLEVIKKYAIRRESKTTEKMLSPICICLQIGVIAYGGVVTVIDYKKDKCIDNTSNFMQNIKLTLVYLVLMSLIVTIYMYIVLKQNLYKYKAKLEFLR